MKNPFHQEGAGINRDINVSVDTLPVEVKIHLALKPHQANCATCQVGVKTLIVSVRQSMLNI